MKKKITFLLANIIVSLFTSAVAGETGQQEMSNSGKNLQTNKVLLVSGTPGASNRKEFDNKPKQQKNEEQLRFEKKQAVSKGLPAEGFDKAIREFNQNLSR